MFPENTRILHFPSDTKARDSCLDFASQYLVTCALGSLIPNSTFLAKLFSAILEVITDSAYLEVSPAVNLADLINPS